MESKIRRIVLGALLLTIFTFSPFAMGTAEQPAATEDDTEYRLFTDSLGREVMLPYPIERICPSGNLAQMMLTALCPDRLVGLARPLTKNAMSFMLPYLAELPAFGNFYGPKADINREAVIMADPQVIIDVGESNRTLKDDLDRLQEDTGIPVIYIEGFLDNTDETMRNLGSAIGLEEEAEKLASYAERILTLARERREMIAEPVTAYYSSSPDGLNGFPTRSFHGEILDFLGIENVIPEGFSSGGNQMSIEQLLVWNPDMMFIQNADAYQSIMTDGKWSGLDAVANDKVFLIPILPYPFLSNPPALNRMMGILWLGKTCYPDLWTDIDMIEEMKTFYSLFYHYDLTDGEAENILKSTDRIL